MRLHELRLTLASPCYANVQVEARLAPAPVLYLRELSVRTSDSRKDALTCPLIHVLLQKTNLCAGKGRSASGEKVRELDSRAAAAARRRPVTLSR